MSERAVSSCMITVCRGFEPGRCRFSLVEGGLSSADVDAAVAATGWDDFVKSRARGPLMQHDAFKVALTGCANGCSRPHIMDVGLIRAERPGAADDACTACGLCIRQCPEGALTPMGNDSSCPATMFARPAGTPVLDVASCVSCGRCLRRCPEHALPVVAAGWRIVVGGRLGRRPRLATELPGIFDDATALVILDRAARWFMRDHRPGLRFADIVAKSPEGLSALVEGV